MLSVFDLIKIGIGPSSSHTVGPWIAASHFLKILKKKNQNIKSIDIFLYGSLAKTGKGHGTDVAVVMGLLNEDYKTIDPAQIMPRFNAIKDGGMITIFSQTICFDYEKNLHFQSNITLDAHPNGMKFLVLLEDDTSFEKTYFSIGGGFVVDDNQESIHSNCESEKKALYPYASEKEIFRYCKTFNCNISDFVFKNELSWRAEEQIHHQALFLWNSMQESIWRGLNAEGFLPGHLRVARRAKSLSRKLLPQSCFRDLKTLINHIRKGPKDFNTVNKWISIFALSVNEENAALGKIVTAPTNGSSGVMPAVMMYATCFLENFTPSAITKFILTAGSIGILYKINATISAAMGGCQAEIGVSSSMSAGALVEFLGGSKEQVMKAAEIAMEHHLGMTCDPIGGLVQIPCIERNIMGAVKAITAANVTIEESVEHQKIFLDDVIQTLWSTALDMSHKYKETSEGGLALIPLNIAEC